MGAVRGSATRCEARRSRRGHRTSAGNDRGPARPGPAWPSPRFQALSGDATSTRSAMKAARLERYSAARTVTATSTTSTKGAAILAGRRRPPAVVRGRRPTTGLQCSGAAGRTTSPSSPRATPPRRFPIRPEGYEERRGSKWSEREGAQGRAQCSLQIPEREGGELGVGLCSQITSIRTRRNGLKLSQRTDRTWHILRSVRVDLFKSKNLCGHLASY